ncbi:EFR1 family ferrodoxin [Anaerocolumna jejuensis]|uniref:EFR1 family ferrodoxin n=1 Tax=Anaerocolumna jejuensis TaxID=259063 RepID=UPI001A9A6259
MVSFYYTQRRLKKSKLNIFIWVCRLISHGICRNVCPAKNITLEAGQPVFHHHCESCLACIQHCPKMALNYKDKTQNRRRYTHPQVGHKKVAGYYK